METLKLKILEFLSRKFILGWAVQFWEKATGYKTQICMALWVIVYIGKMTNYIDNNLADQVLTGLEVAGGFSFMQKLKRYQPIIDDYKNNKI